MPAYSKIPPDHSGRRKKPFDSFCFADQAGKCLHAGICREPAVDGEHNAGDGGSCFAIGEEEHAAQQFFAVHKPAHGGAFEDFFRTDGGRSVRVKEQGSVLVAHKEAGGDGVGPDAAAREVRRQPLGEIGNGGFGPGAGGYFGQRDVSVHGGNVQDAAVLTTHHVLGESLGGQQGALEIQLEYEIHTGSIQVEEGFLAFLGFMLVFVVRGGPGIVAARAGDDHHLAGKVHVQGKTHDDVHLSKAYSLFVRSNSFSKSRIVMLSNPPRCCRPRNAVAALWCRPPLDWRQVPLLPRSGRFRYHNRRLQRASREGPCSSRRRSVGPK